MSEVDASADTARDEMIANFVQISGNQIMIRNAR